jgi:inhibitor of KinA
LTTPEAAVTTAGDAALVVTLPPRLDVETSSRVVAMADAARRRFGAVLRDIVVGYHTLTVYFDPLSVDGAWLEGELAMLAGDPAPVPETSGAAIEVPVCYGGDLGPDLGSVAALAGCTEAEVIELHCSREYRVFMVGFVPGFAYMGPVDPRLALPRRANPRTRVPAGSIGLAAGQTGVYPMETPGGWHLIGRTPVKPFDQRRAEPVLFRPGDRVRFTPISREDFDRSPG